MKKLETMKKLNTLPTVLVATFCLLLFSFNASAQNVGINATGVAPDESALLDLKSESKGFLIPRLTTTQRDAISTPANILMIFNSTTKCFEVYNSNTSSWESFYCLCPLPAVAIANTGSNILTDGFDANWFPVNGATNYYIDVADNAGFNNPIVDDQSVGNVTTYSGVGLTCGTDYYYRVRAENTCGITTNSSSVTVTTGRCPFSICGDPFTDTRDNKTYGTVKIGNQCWMAENLNYSSSSGNYWCYADNANNCETYGILYDWNTASNTTSSITNPSGVKGVCPMGWHLPSDAEWKELEMNLGMTQTQADGLNARGTNEGTQLRATSFGGSNSSGFTALPGGTNNGSFVLEGSWGYWWSATESGSAAWNRFLTSGQGGVYRVATPKGFGRSVRCVKN